MLGLYIGGTGWQKWLNYVSVAFYIGLQYYSELRRGRIDPPCMRQFITISVGVGVLLLYYATGAPQEVNRYIHEMVWVAVIMLSAYVYTCVEAKGPKPDAEYLVSCYKKQRVAQDSPQDCVICLELVTYLHNALCCRHCKKVFHRKCLSKWCEESAACPHCRYVFH